ncbi:hypothetical protein [Paenibacillus sedimenti]|uniref:Uncharacterized protein n=1 Tax=Paenibacillus sedimenti TaxID=2770274 RepID=A0A926KWB9_9BACL|nr:hypothetical protein [Paenibacillus sedimenti]MBD0383324.1 hypothetical protein [Paenibacillus sedimenti]
MKLKSIQSDEAVEDVFGLVKVISQSAGMIRADSKRMGEVVEHVLLAAVTHK